MCKANSFLTVYTPSLLSVYMDNRQAKKQYWGQKNGYK